MTPALRLAAIAIAIFGFIDPAIAWRTRVPLPIRVIAPAASHPDAARAAELRGRIGQLLEHDVEMDGASEPRAIVLIGDAPAPRNANAPIFAVPVPRRPVSTSIGRVTTPEGTVPGQAVTVTAEVRATGLAGRRSAMTLEIAGAAVDTIAHDWTAADQSFRPQWAFVPPGPGAHRVRVRVRTDGADDSVADALVVVRAARLSVLAYESRPTWPLAFVRRSLEADSLFDVAASSRTSRPVATASAGAPRSLDVLDLDRFQAAVIGALDELRETDLAALDRFVSTRGGTLILVPDRQVPEPVRRRFDLPRTDEVLLENPATVHLGDASMRASEFLTMGGVAPGVDAIATVRQGSADRPVIVTLHRGRGRIVLSGALDAWRFRAQDSGGFDRLWRGVVADAALGAVPRLDVHVTPSVARPGDSVQVVARMRVDDMDGRMMDAVAASIAGAEGQPSVLRMWPGAGVGILSGELAAPAAGHYAISVAAGARQVSVPLLVALDVVRPSADLGAAVEHAAQSTGGRVIERPEDLRAALLALEPPRVERPVHPMRSGWWLAPFSLLLCAEWMLRRRSGLK